MSHKKQSVQSATPQKVNLTQAAKLACVSRSTLHRYLNTGKLSKEIDHRGNPLITISELERVYGTLQHRDSVSDSVSKVSKLQLKTPNQDSVLQHEIETLNKQIEEKINIIKTKDEIINDLRNDKTISQADKEFLQSELKKATMLLSHGEKQSDNQLTLWQWLGAGRKKS